MLAANWQTTPMQNGTLLAAIDLGSNSFRLEIGRYDHGHIQRVEYLKEGVRQGGGLGEDRNLSDVAMQRGWDCLAALRNASRVFSAPRCVPLPPKPCARHATATFSSRKRSRSWVFPSK